MAARSLLLLVALLAAASAASAWRPLFPIVQPSVDSLLGVEDKFGAFLVQYGKNYTGTQYLHRLKVFRDNLVKATLNQVRTPQLVEDSRSLCLGRTDVKVSKCQGGRAGIGWGSSLRQLLMSCCLKGRGTE